MEKTTQPTSLTQKTPLEAWKSILDAAQLILASTDPTAYQFRAERAAASRCVREAAAQLAMNVQS